MRRGSGGFTRWLDVGTAARGGGGLPKREVPYRRPHPSSVAR